MSRIKTYARLKPLKSHQTPTTATTWFRTTDDVVEINIPESENMTQFARKGRVRHSFAFDRVFDANATQAFVYENVADDVIKSFLSGYNATIFAYGQTGSGKTFTIEGGYRRYDDRGLVPRTLENVYQALEARSRDEELRVEISFMEIYQEVGYDLLNPGLRDDGMTTELPRVVVLQADRRRVVFRNLSTHLAANEKVAQSLLFQGRTNRKVAETPMNKRSSRSHAVFTIHLTARQKGSPVIVTSKLNLVDLAGSERVAKTSVVGRALSEAKHINRSLHHLEHVIVSLQQRKATATHVPYRNSLLTTVLRDSLGGNCLTAMVATISADRSNVWESISTCRFAQRVARISNSVKKNEMLDDKEIIKRLRKRIVELETELKNATSTQTPQAIKTEALTKEQLRQCRDLMTGYVDGTIDNPVDSGVNDVRMFRECLHLLKTLITKLAQAKSAVETPVVDKRAQRPDAQSEGYNSRSTSRTSGFSSAAQSSAAATTAQTAQTSVPSSTSPREAWSTRAPPEAKRLSTRPSVELEKRVAKLETVKRSQAQMQAQLSLQQLSMLEEDYRDQVETLREQVAAQHARILLLRKQGGDQETLAKEKLAEHQLRIRESRMHQKLLEVRQQLTGDSVRVDATERNRVQSLPIDSRRVYSELQKQEAEQLQVRCHLEEMRMAQIEQQLALKEAATRRKLQAFKEQLKWQKETSKTSPTPQPPLHHHHTHHAETEKQRERERTLSVERETKDRLSSLRLNMGTYKLSSSKETSSSDNKIASENREKTTDRLSSLRGTSKEVIVSESASPKRLAISDEHREKTKDRLSSLRLNSGASKEVIVSESASPKRLAISDEHRERQFVSAASRHKSRVDRIRRAMKAASTIQRAWKRYKKKRRRNRIVESK